MIIDGINGYDDRQEAKSRKYWSEIVLNAEQTAKSGHNLEATISLVDRALAILKAAVPA